MCRLVDAGGLHVALDMRFQGANFKVSGDAPENSIYSFGKCEMQFRRFIVLSGIVMDEAVSIAIDAINVVTPELIESYSRRTLSYIKQPTHLSATRSDFRSFAGKPAIVTAGGCMCGSEQHEGCY